MEQNLQDSLLSIVRLGINHAISDSLKGADWPAVQSFAERQGLYAIALDGIDKLPASSKPSQGLLLEWIGNVFQNYESRYEQYCKTLAEMAGFYNKHGLKMMVLKGYACGLNWPKPEHRPYGDIDIWQFGEYKKADALLQLEKEIKVDNSHHHHTVFMWSDFMVENHYDFINVHHHRSNVELEKVFKEFGQDDSYYVEVFGERVYLPSPYLHALFLLKHTMNDFTAFSITLRQVLDWGFFVKKHTKQIEWERLTALLHEYHMSDFFNCINGICVENLGFDASIFPEVQYLPILKERVLADIINPRYGSAEPKCFVPRLCYKYQRWKGNAWKHELCYNESIWSAFWSGIWSHLLKPKSI